MLSSLTHVGIVVMTAHIQNGVATERFQWFCGAAIFTHLLTVFSFFRVYRHLKEARPFAVVMIIRQFINIGLFASLFWDWSSIPEWRTIALVCTALSKDFYVLFIVLSTNEWFQKRWKILLALPLHLEHFTERLGGFIIIVLGVSIDNVATKPRVDSMYFLFTVVLAFFVVFSMKLLHFDTDIKDLQYHALRVNRYKGAVWGTVMHYLSCAITFIGSAIKLVLEAANLESSDYDHGQYYLAMAMGWTLTLMTVMKLCHTQKFELKLYPEQHNGNVVMRRVFHFQVAAQVLASVTCFCIAKYQFWDPVVLLAALNGITIFLVLVNLMDEYIESKCLELTIESSPLLPAATTPAPLTPLSPRATKRRYYEVIELMDFIQEENLRTKLQEKTQELFHRLSMSPSPGSDTFD